MIAAVAFGAAASAFQALAPGDVAYTGLYAAVVVTMIVMARAIRRTRSPGVGTWWFAVAGLGLIGLGGFSLSIVEPYLATNPTLYLVPGLLWLGGYLCYMVTETLLVAFHWRRRHDRAMVLDALVVFVAVMVPVVELLARPTFAEPGPLLIRALNTSFVLFDGLMVVLLAQLILTGDRRNPSLWFIVAAVSTVVIGDFAVILAGTIVEIRYLSAFLVFCYVFMMLTMLHPQLAGITAPTHGNNARLDRSRAVILGLALMTVPITIVLAMAGKGVVDIAFLLIAAGVVAVLVLLRLTWLFGDREAAQRAVETRERYFRALVRNIGDVISAVGRDGTLEYRSQSAGRLFGGADLTPRGGDGFAFVHPEDRHIADDLFARALAEPGRVVRGELRAGNDTTQWWLEVTLQNLLHDADVDSIVVTCHDVTERHALEDELRHEAFHDALTGLPNRALALERLDRLVQRSVQSDSRVAVAFIDLDHFKAINDTLGHSAGDELLRSVSDRLSLAIRPQDTVARLGGDEFLVLFETSDDAPVEQVAARIVDSLAEPFVLAGREATVTVSVGVASSSGAQTSDELLRDADIALYRVKGSGRNAYSIFTADMADDAPAEQEADPVKQEADLVADLRRALGGGDELRVYFQPIVELGQGRATGVEALVRWQHPQHGLLLPDAFIPLAEAHGLIGPLGAWVLQEACCQVATLPVDIELAVNISARQLDDDSLVGTVRQALASSGLPASRLTLELTESSLMGEGPPVDRLHALKALGVRLAVDDFGTGYSSLAYLRDLPIDTLKVDREFVAGIADDAAAALLTTSVLDLARSLGLRTVAEGVEELGQARVLREGNCELAQGYLFARPAPLEDLRAAMNWAVPQPAE